MQIKKNSKIVNLIKFNYRLIYFSFFEFLRTFSFFYLRKPILLIIDFIINIRFFFVNPHKELFFNSKAKLRNFNSLYGETPYSAWNKICQESEISSEDIIYDLGCGLGKICFWTYLFIKCQKIIGIDRSESFISFANKLKKYLFFKENLIFLNEDFLESDFSNATVIYIYGSAFSLSMIKKLIENLLQKASLGAKIITVSYSLLDFKEAQHFFTLVKKFSCKFSWGYAFVYVHCKK